jgi:acetyl-CoA/propionyl-CoA carboxylase biotin carboxyl carrier protein
MVAKLIVTGATREEALARSRRALDEMQVEGLPTVLPFHRKIVNDPAFIGDVASNKFGIYTRWIETEWNNDIAAWNGIHEDGAPAAERNNVVVEVDGKRIEVSLPQRLLAAGGSSHATANAGAAPKRKSHGSASGGAASGNAVKAPMQSTVVKIAVAVGDTVAEGDLVVVLEAMKMEQPMSAHKSGVVKSISAEVGVTVPAGTVLLELE